MSPWVRNLVMVVTLVVWGAVVWQDVSAGHRPDPMVLVIPAGVYTMLLTAGGKKDPPDEEAS